MTSLHIVSVSPWGSTALADALRLADRGDALLLTLDGVYAALDAEHASRAPLDDAAARGITLYALLPDVDARGLAGRLRRDCGLVDDQGFVALTERFPRILGAF